MNINRLPIIDNAMSQAEVYTNLKGLQSINMEKDRDEALKKVAQQFESLFVNMMTKSMRQANAVFEKDSLFNSNETNFYRDMLDQQRALTLSHGRGLGIAEAMYRQMSKNYGRVNIPNDTFSQPPSFERPTPTSPSHHAQDHGQNTSQNTSAVLHTQTPQDTRVVEVKNNQPFARSPEEFVEKLLPYAKKAAAALGVDHLLLIAQSALETGWGRHILSDNKGQSSFNLFNIKKGSLWNNDTVTHTTVEYRDGKFAKEKADFRSYQDINESFNDYHTFITGNARYAKAVEFSANPSQYIQELQNAGYATDPHYSKKVLSVYDRINQFVDSLPALLESEVPKIL